MGEKVYTKGVMEYSSSTQTPTENGIWSDLDVRQIVAFCGEKRNYVRSGQPYLVIDPFTDYSKSLEIIGI
jgi:hypothetical protein